MCALKAGSIVVTGQGVNRGSFMKQACKKLQFPLTFYHKKFILSIKMEIIILLYF